MRKLNAYYEYLETGRFRRDDPCFPAVLVVTTSNAAEGRFARAAQVDSVGRYTRLPLLLTATWRIFNDPTNRSVTGDRARRRARFDTPGGMW